MGAGMRHGMLLLAVVLFAPITSGLSQETGLARRTVFVTLRVDDVFMSESPIQPQEIDSFLTVLEAHGARLQLAVIPHRLLEPANANGRMAKDLRRLVERGHMVSLHGWNHRHEPTGNTGAEFQDPATGAWVPFGEHLRKTRLGKELLEQTTGKPVTAYVSPGSDDQLDPQNVRVIRELGIRWLSKPDIREPEFTDTLWYVPELRDYTWALEESTYAAAMDSARAGFLRTAARSRFFGLLFHDHFTRWGWRKGIVTRWIDEFLKWMEGRPEYEIRYVTLEGLRPSDIQGHEEH
jgi:peptidoglycan/xylan/chitin deacetylase (PgdA/CDA1 family)